MIFSRLILVPIILGVALPFDSVAQANTQGQQPRLSVWMFRVQSQDEAAKSGFNEWHSLLSNNLPSLAKLASSGATYLEKLSFDGTDRQEPPTLDLIRTRWNEARALQVLSAVSLRDKDVTIIDSQVFLGDLRGHLPSDFLHVRQRVVTSDYRITRDSIALVTLYALAMDSERLKRQAAITCGLLSEARSIADDLNLKKLELESLGIAIKTSLKTNACGARP